MRCLLCKVDIEDNHKTCPLCEKTAVISAQQIELLTAPYPIINILTKKSKM